MNYNYIIHNINWISINLFFHYFFEIDPFKFHLNWISGMCKIGRSMTDLSIVLFEGSSSDLGKNISVVIYDYFEDHPSE